MALLKLLLYSFLFLQILTTISSNGVGDSDADSSIRLQLDQLNSKISILGFFCTQFCAFFTLKWNWVYRILEIYHLGFTH